MNDQDIKVTYETIYDIFRNEKVRQELQKLDPDFINNIKNYLGEKQAILKSQIGKRSIFSSTETQKTLKQIESIQKMLKELQERREAKIIELALFHVRTGHDIRELSHMLVPEQEFFAELTTLLRKNKNSILGEIYDTPEEPKDLKKSDNKSESKKVVFTEDVQEFVGADLKVYGPYKVHDSAELPADIARLLVKKEKALLGEQS